MSLDPGACRIALSRLIGEEAAALEELTGLLEQEHEHLLSNDVVALQQAMRTRQGCVTRILRADEERRVLCRRHGKENSIEGLTQLMQWCDPAGELAGAWRRCAEAATRAQQSNDRNGTFVGARLKHVQERLGALLEARRLPHTYGRRGGQQSGSDPGRILAAEA